MYPDETTVYCIGSNVDQVISSLNETMKQVLMWRVKNQLTIHQIKTEAMVLKKSDFVGPLPPLYFETSFINLVDSTTCPGVEIHNRFSWCVCIDSVKEHFTQNVLSILKKMRILPKQSLEEIYFKSMIPSVTYGILVWGNCSGTLGLCMNFVNSIYVRASPYYKQPPEPPTVAGR